MMAARPAPPWLLLLVTVALPQSCFGASSHSLKYFSTSISDPSQGEQPHFVAVGYVDDQIFVHYDSHSHSQRMKPRVSWMEKVGKEDPKYWDTNTQNVRDSEEAFRVSLGNLRSRYNQSEGLHTLQGMYGCELCKDGAKDGFFQYGYEGKTFITFDKETLIWVAPDPQAQITQRKWDADPGRNERDKSYLEEICIEWLKKYLSYGKETLQRTEPPVVTVSRRTEVEDGMETHICRVDGFYPREIDASWKRDGEEWLEETFHGSVVPNADGTYHYWLSIQIDPKERSRYRCHVEHDGLQEPLDLKLKGASSHSLKYFSTSISDPSQGQKPYFVSVAYVDDQVFSYYDNDSRTMKPRASWMEKLGKEDPQYWDRETKIFREHERLFGVSLENLRILYNQSEGLHTWQEMSGCELREDGSKGGFIQYGYEGRTFLTFDKETLTWVAHNPQAQIAQRKFPALRILNKEEVYLEEICIEWLERFLSYGKETLLRTETPKVTVSSRTEAEDGMETHICRVDGFYPREIDASWRRDGEVWLEETFHGSVAPNADGTYHYWLSIRIDPKERSLYRCHVEHDSLQELKEPSNSKSNLGLIISCVVAALVLACAIAGILIFFKKCQDDYKAAPTSDRGSSISNQGSIQIV